MKTEKKIHKEDKIILLIMQNTKVSKMKVKQLKENTHVKFEKRKEIKMKMWSKREGNKKTYNGEMLDNVHSNSVIDQICQCCKRSRMHKERDSKQTINQKNIKDYDIKDIVLSL